MRDIERPDYQPYVPFSYKRIAILSFQERTPCAQKMPTMHHSISARPDSRTAAAFTGSACLQRPLGIPLNTVQSSMINAELVFRWRPIQDSLTVAVLRPSPVDIH
jgi:hypothetical protein